MRTARRRLRAAVRRRRVERDRRRVLRDGHRVGGAHRIAARTRARRVRCERALPREEHIVRIWRIPRPPAG